MVARMLAVAMLLVLSAVIAQHMENASRGIKKLFMLEVNFKVLEQYSHCGGYLIEGKRYE